MKNFVKQIQSSPDMNEADFSANLRFISRQLSIQSTGQAFQTFRNDETRADFAIIVEKYEKFLETVSPQNLAEFSNLPNVLRMHSVDGNIPLRVKSKLVKRINTIFTDPAFTTEINEMSFDQVSKILSDSVHFGNVGILGMKLEEMLDKNIVIQNLTSVVRLLDSLMASENGIEQLDRLVRKLE